MIPENINQTPIVDDSEILNKVGQTMKNIKMNRELRELASSKGLNIRNTVEFTEKDEENTTIGVVALLLAQKARDPEYINLVKVGTNHRQLRAKVINNYKNAAIQLVTRYKNSLKEANANGGFVE